MSADGDIQTTAHGDNARLEANGPNSGSTTAGRRRAPVPLSRQAAGRSPGEESPATARTRSDEGDVPPFGGAGHRAGGCAAEQGGGRRPPALGRPA